MSTIRDVAKEAGVSIATVSYYINNKRVSEKNSLKIREAIDRLGYIANSPGRNLKYTRTNVGVILPDYQNPVYVKMFQGIRSSLEYKDIPYSIMISEHNEERERTIIKELIGKRISGLVLYSIQQNMTDTINLLNEHKIPFVLIDNRPEHTSCNCVDVDNSRLFHSLVRQLHDHGRQDIMLMCGFSHFRTCMDAKDGFLKAMNEAGSTRNEVINVIPTRESAFRKMMDYLSSGKKVPKAILTTSYIIADGIRCALQLHRVEPGKDVLLICTGDSIEDIFYNDSTIIKTGRNAFKIGYTSAELLIENMNSPYVFQFRHITIRDPEPDIYVQNRKKTESPNSSKKIKVLLIDDSYSSYALQQLIVDFEKSTGMKVEATILPPEDLYAYITDHSDDENWDMDVLLTDIPWLEDLVHKKIIMPIDDYVKNNMQDFSHFIPGVLEKYGMAGNRYYAIPYMCCTQLLFYRKDLFTAETYQRQFENRYKIPLEPPGNWAHFRSICEFFTRKFNRESPTEYGTSMDLAYTEEIMGYLYPRIWATGTALFDRHHHLSMNTWETRNALINLYDCMQFSASDTFRKKPSDLIHDLISGDTAMVMTYYYFASQLTDYSNLDMLHKIGWATIPGSCPVLSGWSFAISSSSHQPDEAFEFIKWASCKQLSIANSILGGQSPSEYAAQNFDIISLYPWLTKGVRDIQIAHPREIPSELNSPVFSEKKLEEIISEEVSYFLSENYVNERDLNLAAEKTLLICEKKIRNLKKN